MNGVFQIFIAAVFAVLGCRYVDSLNSYNELVLPVICMVVPIIVVMVVIGTQALMAFFRTGWYEAEQKIKEKQSRVHRLY